PKQKYGFKIGYAKKALDYTIQADKVDEFVNYLERFIEDTKNELDKRQDVMNIENLIVIDPIRVQHKGRQPNQYKSGGEVPSKRKVLNTTNTNNQVSNDNGIPQSSGSGGGSTKRVRHCQKYKKVGYYALRYPNL
ncbi:3145_t:CDS:1, partial [Racocetra fulgida]